LNTTPTIPELVIVSLLPTGHYATTTPQFGYEIDFSDVSDNTKIYTIIYEIINESGTVLTTKTQSVSKSELLPPNYLYKKTFNKIGISGSGKGTTKVRIEANGELIIQETSPFSIENTVLLKIKK